MRYLGIVSGIRLQSGLLASELAPHRATTRRLGADSEIFRIPKSVAETDKGQARFRKSTRGSRSGRVLNFTIGIRPNSKIEHTVLCLV
jgi:hypothetical protein